MSDTGHVSTVGPRCRPRSLVVIAVALINCILLLAFDHHVLPAVDNAHYVRVGVAPSAFMQRRLYLGVQPNPEPCPRGMYRPAGSGVTVGECEFCPRGVYGDSPGLLSSDCTARCPKGTYNDKIGAKSILDCTPCPRGVYGAATGLTTSECSGPCPNGKYSMSAGLQSANECMDCPAYYRGPQGFRGNDVLEVNGGGYPCDRYLVGKTTIVNGRNQAVIDTINAYLSVDRESNKQVIDNVTRESDAKPQSQIQRHLYVFKPH